MLFSRSAHSPLAVCGLLLCLALAEATAEEPDPIRGLQADAINNGVSPALHWGIDPAKYTGWSSHSNRLVPVYTFGTLGAGEGIDLSSYMGASSPYRSEAALLEIYGRVPGNTLNPTAEYLDQTSLAELQRAALDAGRKYIFLVVFDGMDWDTTRAAAIYNMGKVAYDSGRGTGLHFLDYTAAGTTQFGYAVVSPSNATVIPNVNEQRVLNTGATPGGYNPLKGGPNPWTAGSDPAYLIADTASGKLEHARPDSSGTATSLTTGAKTYNLAIGVDRTGTPLKTIAHTAQERGFAVGAVSSVPISHATPAAAYAHNVTRDDFQDLTRDMLGLPSISHPEAPLPGMDVVIGTGFGVDLMKDPLQGKNFVPGNQSIAPDDLRAIDVANGGKYTVALRTAGRDGSDVLREAAQRAIHNRTRLFGFFGVGKPYNHLPYRTANGDYRPTLGLLKQPTEYTAADLQENPTLAEMTKAAIDVLSQNPNGFWLMMEPGDVDWANHQNNIDDAIGAVLSGDEAVKVITDWVEEHSNWSESLLIVTADHGHFLVLDRPEALTGHAAEARPATGSANASDGEGR